jgi:ribosomal protein S18 acetylase RimI-like enzyme
VTRRRNRGGRNGAAAHAPFHGLRLAGPARPRARAEGYATRDETLILAAPVADIAEAPPPVSCFEIWPPLAVQEEIWAPAASARRARHHGAAPKVPRPPYSAGSTTVPPRNRLHRSAWRRSRCSMRSKWHPSARRNGLARLMVRAGAAWAADRAPTTFTVLVTRANGGAAALRFLGPETCGKLSLSSEMKANRAP